MDKVEIVQIILVSVMMDGQEIIVIHLSVPWVVTLKEGIVILPMNVYVTKIGMVQTVVSFCVHLTAAQWAVTVVFLDSVSAYQDTLEIIVI